MRSLAATAFVTVLLVAGLCGCQSCVDEPQPSQTSQPSTTGGALGSMPRIRPHRFGPAHVFFHDAGAAGTDDGGSASGD